MAFPTLLDVASRAMSEKKSRKRWISKAIKHPGRETEKAKRNGVSVHAQMAKDSHSSDPSVRAAGNLGLRLSSMGHKKKSRMYSDDSRKRMGD